MLGQRLQSLWKTAFIACALFAAPTIVRSADVSDEAGFFSAAAIEKANAAIKEIEKKSGHDVRIETHATVPKDQVEAVAKMDRGEQQKFMDRWVHERAKAVKETGVLILICKSPGRVETWFSGKLAEGGITKMDRQRVIDAAVNGMKSKDYDATLSDTITKVGDVFGKLSSASKLRSDSGHREPLSTASSTPPHQGRPIHQAMPAQQVNSMSWMYVIGFIIAAIFVIRLLSGIFGGRSGGYPQGPGQPGMGGYPPGGYPPGAGYGPAGYGGGGGGGFMRGLAGGIFGAMAGNWLYDSFGGGHSAHAQGPMSDNSDPLSGSRTLGHHQPADDGGWTDDGSSSGGGWYDNGDSGGGGDFGDSGGGDFGGGGDSGGGDF